MQTISDASKLVVSQSESNTVTPTQIDIQQALSALDVDRLVLAIHDQSFPSAPDEEIGRGSPYSEGGVEFVKFIHSLGFTGIQFGPQGKTSPGNPSPYDGTLFSKSELSISLKALTQRSKWQAILDEETLADLVEECPASQPESLGSFDYKYALNAENTALREAFKNFVRYQSQLSSLWDCFDEWTQLQRPLGGDWLLRDAMFEIMTQEYGTDDWRTWSELDRHLFSPSPDEQEAAAHRIESLRQKYAEEIRFYFFCQFVVHSQHSELEELAHDLGLKFYGDFQIGYSPRDTWSCATLFLPSYLIGAPPSRTNPDGQPWGFPVLDPNQYFADDASDSSQRVLGPALVLFKSRIEKMLSEFDGIRLDHPHGLVCPWVYKASDPEPMKAVKSGGRLFSSPNLDDHPTLAPLAIAEPNQINPERKDLRYADDWLTDLRDDQVDRFAVLIDVVMQVMRQAGSPASDIVCEVLSTCPYPLKRVLERYHLGRFRVTQKASTADPKDGYRSENAAPSDWIMLGNHDTKPVWRVIAEWQESGEIVTRAAYLAERLEPNEENRQAFADDLVSNPSKFSLAMFADLFASPARNVSIFFPDLLGMKDVYNQPGTVSDTNWSLRVPHNYKQLYAERISSSEAASLPKALAMALRARYPQPGAEVAALISKLNQ